MSSELLREAMRTAWPTITPSLPYLDTINLPVPKPLPNVWGTLAFTVQTRRILTMGSSPWIEEQGSAMVVVVARAGDGDGPGIQAATDAMAAWDGWITGTNIWLQNVRAPIALELETLGDWMVLGVECSYRLQEKKAL